MIQQGPNTQNPNMITYGVEESIGARTNSGTNVSIADNTIVNDLGGGHVLLNSTSVAVPFTNNNVYGFTASQLSNGPLDESGTVFLASRPSLDTSSLSFINPPADGGTGGSGDSGSGGTAGAGGGDSGNGGGGNGGTTVTPPPPPPPAETLDDYHTMVINDFLTYAAANQTVLTDPNAINVLFGELASTTVPTMPVPGDLWS